MTATPPRIRAALTLLALAGMCAAQGPTPGEGGVTLRAESQQAARRLEELRERTRAGRPDADGLLRLLDEAGDALVPVGPGRWAGVRALVGRELRKLPPDARRESAERLEAEAKRRTDDAVVAGDADALAEVVSARPVAPSAARAAWHLGELALEAGDPARADAAWALLEQNDGHGYDFASILARRVLAAAVAGDGPAARPLLNRLRERHTTARGRLAGRDGVFVETLAPLVAGLGDAPTDPPRPPDWGAFGGAPDRNPLPGGDVPKYLSAFPAWRVPLGGRDPSEPAAPPELGLGGNPSRAAVVARGAVWVNDGGRVLRIDARTGRSTLVYRAVRPEPPAVEEEDDRPPVPAMEAVAAGRDVVVALAGGRLLGFPLDVDAPARPAWELSPGDGSQWVGAPVLSGGRMFACGTRRSAGREVLFVRAFDSVSARPAPRELWTREVAEWSGEAGDALASGGHLCLAGGTLVVGPVRGVAVALDAATGRPAWATAAGAGESRELAPAVPVPCVAAGGRVLVPVPSRRRLLCLDRFTGDVLWERDDIAVRAVHGVSRGLVIVSTGGTGRGLRALAVADGADRWSAADAGGPLGAGQGLVLGASVLWPTRSGLFQVSANDGSVLRQPLGVRGGNLAFADGVLVLTSGRDVCGWVDEARRLEEREAAAADGGRADRWRLARSLAARGEPERAARLLDPADARDRRLLTLTSGREPPVFASFSNLAPVNDAGAADGPFTLVGEEPGEAAPRRLLWLREPEPPAPPIPPVFLDRDDPPAESSHVSESSSFEATPSGTIRRVDKLAVRWTLDLPGRSGLTGAPIGLGHFGDRLVVVAPRNTWTEVDALNPETGRRAWAESLRQPEGADIDASGAAGGVLALPTGGDVLGVSLADGRVRWRVARMADPARFDLAARAAGGLLAVTVSPRWPEFVPPPALAGFLPASRAYDDGADPAGVWLLDPADGSVLQHVTPNRHARLYWSLSGRAFLAVSPDARRVWRMAP